MISGISPTELYGGVVLFTVVFPFWNLVRGDVHEVIILSSNNGVCYVETSDMIPKTIEQCWLAPGDAVTIKFGEGLAWATLVDSGPMSPDN